MTASQWLELVAPFLGPALLAALAAVITPALTTTRRLRQDLHTDTEMLERVPRGARAELRADIQRRTHLLVAQSRYPPLTTNGALTIGFSLMFLAIASFLISRAEPRAGSDIALVLLAEAVAYFLLALWLFGRGFYQPWARRAVKRLAYVDEHLGRASGAELAQRLAMVHLIIALTTFAGSAVFSFQSVEIMLHAYWFPDGADLLLRALVPLLVLLWLSWLQRRSRLHAAIKRFRPGRKARWRKAVTNN